MVKPIPDGYHTLTPYLTVRDAAGLIEYLAEAFGAKELARMSSPEGDVQHAGGQSLREPTTEFYGDRSAGVQDPAGNLWWIATHVEDVSPEELTRRAEANATK